MFNYLSEMLRGKDFCLKVIEIMQNLLIKKMFLSLQYVLYWASKETLQPSSSTGKLLLLSVLLLRSFLAHVLTSVAASLPITDE